jgi:hypothetical protein
MYLIKPKQIVIWGTGSMSYVTGTAVNKLPIDFKITHLTTGDVVDLSGCMNIT